MEIKFYSKHRFLGDMRHFWKTEWNILIDQLLYKNATKVRIYYYDTK